MVATVLESQVAVPSVMLEMAWDLEELAMVMEDILILEMQATQQGMEVQVLELEGAAHLATLEVGLVRAASEMDMVLIANLEPSEVMELAREDQVQELEE
jgi:hypothetical protein